jgi:hypothetical protein
MEYIKRKTDGGNQLCQSMEGYYCLHKTEISIPLYVTRYKETLGAVFLKFI